METVEAIKEMMAAWDKIMKKAKETFPRATEDELYYIAKEVMMTALKMK